jgi:GATA-binding protein
MQNAASVGGIDWNAAMQNAVAWPEIPQQQTPNQQHFQQQLSSSFQPQSFPGSQQSFNEPSASTSNENNPNSNDEIDPALFDTLAELIEQSQKQANGSTTTSPFDFMGALSQAPSPQAAPLAPPPPPPQSVSGMSQSLLTRRLQQHQGGANGMNSQQPPPNQSLFNLQNVLGTSPSVQQPHHLQQQHQSPLSGSLPGSHMSSSLGALPTPPPSFGSSMNASRQVKVEQSPKTPWPLPERAPAYSETPATTPGGSDHGMHSPADVSKSCGERDSSWQMNNAGPSRIRPIRREAPHHPAPLQSPHAQSFSSSYSSSHQPSMESLAAQQMQSMAQLHQQQQHQQQHSGQQPPADWPAGLDPSQLPPLPPGFSMEQLSQMGAAGFEMAIRMGMGIALGMQQNGGTPSAANSTPVTQPPSAQASLATSPADANQKATMESPNLNMLESMIGRENFSSQSPVHQFATSPPISTSAGTGAYSMSRRPSQDGAGSPLSDLVSPEDPSKKDPLAAQVWKAYAKAREGMPNGHKMENLTWRMMHLTLKKQEELAAAAAVKELAERQRHLQDQQRAALQQQQQQQSLPQESQHLSREQQPLQTSQQSQQSQSFPFNRQNAATSALHSDPTGTPSAQEGEQRGRRKGKSRVVGFQNEKSSSPAPE